MPDQAVWHFLRRDTWSRKETIALYDKYTAAAVKQHETGVRTGEGRETHIEFLRCDISELQKANYFDLLKF